MSECHSLIDFNLSLYLFGNNSHCLILTCLYLGIFNNFINRFRSLACFLVSLSEPKSKLHPNITDVIACGFNFIIEPASSFLTILNSFSWAQHFAF